MFYRSFVHGWHLLLFSENCGNGCISLYAVALHEIGHILGLDESHTMNSVMYGFFQAKLHLEDDDIKGIQRLYGVRQPSQGKILNMMSTCIWLTFRT